MMINICEYCGETIADRGNFVRVETRLKKWDSYELCTICAEPIIIALHKLGVIKQETA